jgi:hypothetical protein
MLAQYRWPDIATELATHPAGTRLRFHKSLVEHPRDAGMRPGVGLPVGQRADFRLTFRPECWGLHVQDFGDHYEAHIDQTDPGCDAIKHLQQDAPNTLVAGAALVGGLIGLALGRSAGAIGVGALAGAAIGCLAVAPQVATGDKLDANP